MQNPKIDLESYLSSEAKKIPEVKLWAAVIARAYLDAVSQHQLEAKIAKRWIFSDDEGPLSFSWAAEAISENGASEIVAALRWHVEAGSKPKTKLLEDVA